MAGSVYRPVCTDAVGICRRDTDGDGDCHHCANWRPTVTLPITAHIDNHQIVAISKGNPTTEDDVIVTLGSRNGGSFQLYLSERGLEIMSAALGRAVDGRILRG